MAVAYWAAGEKPILAFGFRAVSWRMDPNGDFENWPPWFWQKTFLGRLEIFSGHKSTGLQVFFTRLFKVFGKLGNQAVSSIKKILTLWNRRTRPNTFGSMTARKGVRKPQYFIWHVHTRPWKNMICHISIRPFFPICNVFCCIWNNNFLFLSQEQ